MKWIGLTGSIGSGKSTVAQMLRESGYNVINADELAHEGLRSGSPVFEMVKNKFGLSIIDSKGEINRRELGRIIFSDVKAKEWLENLLHPMVQSKVAAMRQAFSEAGEKIAFYEVPLLFEKKMMSHFDSVVVVWASEAVQRSRLKQRNQWSDAEITQRLQAQLPSSTKVQQANFAINNDGTLEELRNQVTEMLQKIDLSEGDSKK